MMNSSKRILLTLALSQVVPGHSKRTQFVQSSVLDVSATEKVTGECTDKANKGEWDYDCYKSLTSGSSYYNKYCAYFESQISVTGAAGVSLACAEDSDKYCLALANAGIYYGYCHSAYGGKRTKDAKGYMDALCDLKSASVSEKLSSTTCARPTYNCQNVVKTRCMEDGPIEFCKAIKSEGTYEHKCVLRIGHRSKDDEYCTCSILGGGYWDGKLLRCNEAQDPNSAMDRWDNECLRHCSGYPNNKHLGWYCTPVKKTMVPGGTTLSYSTSGYSGSLKKFGEWEHAANIIQGIQEAENTKRGK